MIIIETGMRDAIRLGPLENGELTISLGRIETGVNHKDFFSYSATDVINKQHAKKIIEHLQKEFKL